MTVLQIAILALLLVPAWWLAFPARGAAAHRLSRALRGAGTRSSATRDRPRSRLPGPGRRAVAGFGRWCGRWSGGGSGRGSAGAGTVPMTVVVQQLAALLKGGRIPARLWDELWVLYGGESARDRPEVYFAAHGTGGGGIRDVSGPVLRAESLRILAAARAAALRGASVAAAIRREVSGEIATGRTGAALGKSAAGVRSGRDMRVWGELAACFDTAEASGCPLADVLARFAAHLETEDDAEAARQTALAGPRATVRLLTWLPLSGLGLGLLLGVDPVATLLGNPWGLLALAAGAVLTTAGRLWSSRLVRAAAGAQA